MSLRCIIKIGDFGLPRKTRFSVTSPPVADIFSSILSGSVYLPSVKYVGTGTTMQTCQYTRFWGRSGILHFSPLISIPSLPSLNKSPTITQASNGPCFPLIVVILETRRGSAERGEPIARLKETGGGMCTVRWGEAGSRGVSDRYQ